MADATPPEKRGGSAEQELARLRERVDNPILRIDGKGKVVLVNRALEALVGIERAHILGYPATRILSRESIARVRTGDAQGVEQLAFVADDGTRRTLAALLERLPDGEIELLAQASVEVPAALVELHGRAAMGAITAEVAHEINNHLLVLGGYAQLMPLHVQRQDWSRVEKDAQMVVAEVERCRVMTDGMLRFSPRSGGETLTPLGIALRETKSFLSRLNRFDSIALTLEIGTRAPAATIAPMLFRQMLLNALSATAGVLHRSSAGRGEIRVALRATRAQAILAIAARPHPAPEGDAPREAPPPPGERGPLPAVIDAHPRISHQALVRICRATDTEIEIAPAGTTIGLDATRLELRLPLAEGI